MTNQLKRRRLCSPWLSQQYVVRCKCTSGLRHVKSLSPGGVTGANYVMRWFCRCGLDRRQQFPMHKTQALANRAMLNGCADLKNLT